MLCFRQSPSLPPPRLEPGLIGWFEPCDPNADGSVNANNSSLASFKNYDASQVNFAQANGASQPLYLLSAFNGKPLIRFGGIQCMTAVVTAVNWFNFVRNFTIAGTFRLSNSANTQQSIIGKGNSAGSPNWMVQINRTAANGKLSFWNGSFWLDSGSGVASSTDLNSYSISWDGTNFLMYLNGVAVTGIGLGSDVTSSTTPLFLGCQGAVSPTNFFNGDLGGQYIWNSAFDAAAHVRWHRFISCFLGLNFAV